MRTSNQINSIIKRRVFILITIVVFILSFFIIFTCKSNASQTQDVYTYYKTIEVQPGDTLWSIACANQQLVESMDTTDYINEIKRINHLGDDNIYSGQYLVISYQSYEYLD